MFDKILHKKKEQSQELAGRRVAIIATNGFEESELFEPKEALELAGAEVEVVSLESGKIKAWNKTDWGKSIAVDKTLTEVSASDYDCLLIPGGVMSPDKLRKEQDAVTFVNGFVDARKPIAAICHGPQLLIETPILKGRTVTSWPSLKTDLLNAGAKWVNEECCCDGGLVTSRKPADIPAFNKKMIEEFVEGRHGLPNVEGYAVTL